MSALDGTLSVEAALAVLAVVAYLRWLGPRLTGRAAWTVTAGLAIAGLAGMVIVGRPAWFALPLLVLLCGHAGLAVRARARRPEGAVDPAAAAAAPSPIAAPPMLGRYRIESEIGRGAMGAVLLGRDVRNDRAVAVKTLALRRAFEGGDLADARQRFRREADAARSLQHPDIVAVLDAGEDQGLACIVMEWVPGHDLLRHAHADRLLPLPTLLRIAARVADALAHAHRQGVVHRDIKPANVIVDLAAGSVKVADFGIARIAGPGRTRTGVVLGTPAYMAPEQLAGQPADVRSDLYALGVTLFQLLAGELPYRSDSMAELLRQIAQEPAPDLRSLRPELPESLAALVARLLEKSPDRRPADGRELAAALRQLAGQIDATAPR